MGLAPGSPPCTSARAASRGRMLLITRGRDLVHGMQTPDGAHTRTATNLGFLLFPPFYFILFPGLVFFKYLYAYQVIDTILALDKLSA